MKSVSFNRAPYKFGRIAIQLSIVLLPVLLGCNKLVQIPAPINSITTISTFSTPATATSALTAIYSDISNGSNASNYGNGGLTITAGQSADELQSFGNSSVYATNTIQPDDGTISAFWSSIYYDIYMANAVIAGVNASNTLSASTKNQLVGEAKFLRAFGYFYLVNMYGDVPLVTTTTFTDNTLKARTPTAQVYDQIIADLHDAQSMLPADYSVSGGQRVRANSWAATALLARTYLYLKYWDSAISEASMIISNTGLYSLDSLNDIFLANSTESILQLIPVSTNDNYATWEGYEFITASGNYPNCYITDDLMGAFENGDERRTAWVDSTNYAGSLYYWPFKYEVQQASSSTITEYYTLFRLAEQYLIRAEAEAESNQLNQAISDLNVIRIRAGLTRLDSSLLQSQVISAAMQERRIELFAEWGHRWFDLKRTGQANQVLDTLSYKPQWTPNAQLYPIPSSEITADPNLTQNPGYQN